MERQPRPPLRLAAAVREHVVFHGIHRREAFVTDSEIRALTEGPRAALIAQRDAYQAMFGEMIRDGIRDGSLRASDAHVATYAILLQCTGVALWFDPSGPLTLEQVAELHVELVLGSLQAVARADRRGDRERLAGRGRGRGVGGWRRGSSHRRCPSRRRSRSSRPASPPQTRSEIEQATAYFEARGHRVVFGPNHRKVHGYLAGTDEERAADLQWALTEPGIDMVHDPLRRLRHRAPPRPDRLGRGSASRGSSAATATSPPCTWRWPRTRAGSSFYGPNFLRFTRQKGD